MTRQAPFCWHHEFAQKNNKEGEMATYKQIANYVKQKSGFVPKTGWIAHVKEINGLKPRRSPNRQGAGRMVPCPP